MRVFVGNGVAVSKGKVSEAAISGVDGTHPISLPALQRFLGGDRFGEPGYAAQFLEVDGHGRFVPHPVEMFKRQLVAVTLANGRPLLLDVFRIKGGQRHDLLWHAPATRPNDQLEVGLGASEPVAGSFNDVLNRANPQRNNQSKPGHGASLLQRLERWPMPEKAWLITFHAQPRHFHPVTEGGKKIYEPWMQVLHDVDLRLWGAAVGSPAETREILGGRMPWPSRMIEVVNGQEISGVISLKDALQFVAESRTAQAPGLSTIYAHVLDPGNPDQPPVVEKVETVAASPADDAAMGVGLRITLAGDQNSPEATRTVLAATTANGGQFAVGGITLEGRLGLIQTANASLTLFDGVRFEAAGFGVVLEPSWRMKLLGVIGDLTGHVGESALIVKSSRPLPTDRTLLGRMLTVEHRISPWHRSGYFIERVTPYGKKNWYRIDLRNCPSFIVNRLRVRRQHPQDPRLLVVDSFLSKGCRPDAVNLYAGRRVRLPRLGFDSAMSLGDPSGWHYTSLRLENAPPSGAVKENDPLIIYQIQPGDDVVIPSHFVCQGTNTAEGLKLDFIATGPATLTVPGAYRSASLLLGLTRAPLRRVAMASDHVQVALEGDEIADGRAVLLLSR